MLACEDPGDHRCEELLAVVGEDVSARVKGIEISVAGAGVSIGNDLIFTAFNTLEDDRGLKDKLVVLGVVGKGEAISLGVALSDYVDVFKVDKIRVSFLVKTGGLINERACIVRRYGFLVVTEIDFYRSFLCNSLGKDGVGRARKGLLVIVAGGEVQTKEGCEYVEHHVKHEDDSDDRYRDRGGENALLTDYRLIDLTLGCRCRFPFLVDLWKFLHRLPRYQL